MAKKGIKLADLAKELGVTSRVLIDRCRGEGLAVQNSITKLPPAAERAIRSWFASAPRADIRDAPRRVDAPPEPAP
jgi:hypothetical protein